MGYCKRTPAAKRYLIRLLVAVTVYVIAVFLTMHIFHHGRLPLPAAIGLAIIPSIPIIAIITIVGLYLKEETDEFQRELYIKSLLWGTGGTLAITSFWSFLHIFAHVPAVDGFHVFVLFWLLVGLSGLPLHLYYNRGGGDE
jgi:hypothetical protein